MNWKVMSIIFIILSMIFAFFWLTSSIYFSQLYDYDEDRIKKEIKCNNICLEKNS